jgi:hypothetical protein
LINLAVPARHNGRPLGRLIAEGVGPSLNDTRLVLASSLRPTVVSGLHSWVASSQVAFCVDCANAKYWYLLILPRRLIVHVIKKRAGNVQNRYLADLTCVVGIMTSLGRDRRGGRLVEKIRRSLGQNEKPRRTRGFLITNYFFTCLATILSLILS